MRPIADLDVPNALLLLDPIAVGGWFAVVAQEAARGSDAGSGNLASVKQAAGHTAQASGSVSQSADSLVRQTKKLTSAVDTFLTKVRAA